MNRSDAVDTPHTRRVHIQMALQIARCSVILEYVLHRHLLVFCDWIMEQLRRRLRIRRAPCRAYVDMPHSNPCPNPYST